MSLAPDPDFWKDMAGWLWALLLLPMGKLWTRIWSAVQKDDFNKYAAEVKETFKAHAEIDEKNAEKTRQSLIDIFQRLDEQGKGIARIETAVSFMRERE